MNFLKKKWPFWVNALLLIFMIMLGLYLFNDTLGFSGVLKVLFGYANTAIREGGVPQVEWTWQIGVFGGVFVGALGGSLIHGSWKLAGAWEECGKFGEKVFKTAVLGILSGFLVMLGAILGGEAFYGQISAATELSAGAWFFLVIALAVGGITALFIERSSEKSSPAGKDSDK